jgi:arylsulfatase A-like enzyme
LVAPASPANLLVVFADELRAQAVGCYDNLDVATPVLDRLAAEGVRFTHAYANAPVCTPSRGCLLTGCWPQRHGAITNDLPVNPAAPSIARVLRAAGYACGYIGKWHLGGIPRYRRIPPGPERLGFDDFWAVWNCHHRYMRPKHYLNDAAEPVILEGRYEPEVQTDLALGWLTEHRARHPHRPFCLFVSYGPPHSPYRPLPPGLEGRYDPARITLRPNCPDIPQERQDLADYYAHTTALDQQLGRLVAYLAETGELDRTLLVFTSDHGSMLGSQGHHYKQQPWEESIAVPLIVRGGPGLPRGVELDLLIGLVDLTPTLLGLLGVPVPAAMQGRDLSAFIREPGVTDGRPTSIYLQEMICCDQAIREGIILWRGVRTARYTYARNLAGPWVLYDNWEDPYQLHNLVDAPGARELLEELEREMEAWMARLDDRLEPAEAVLHRYGLTEAWAERNAHLHTGRNMSGEPPELWSA